MGLEVSDDAASEAGAASAAAAGLLDQLMPAVLKAFRSGRSEVAMPLVPFVLAYVARLKMLAKRWVHRGCQGRRRAEQLLLGWGWGGTGSQALSPVAALRCPPSAALQPCPSSSPSSCFTLPTGARSCRQAHSCTCRPFWRAWQPMHASLLTVPKSPISVQQRQRHSRRRCQPPPLRLWWAVHLVTWTRGMSHSRVRSSRWDAHLCRLGFCCKAGAPKGSEGCPHHFLCRPLHCRCLPPATCIVLHACIGPPLRPCLSHSRYTHK